MLKDKIVIFGSYNKGPEYEEKKEKLEKLKQIGINADLFYLLALTHDDSLPKTNVDLLMTRNIETAIELFKPNILAFHNGLTLSLKTQEFMKAIESVKKSYPNLIYLLQHLNNPQKNYLFRENPQFYKWSEINFENKHSLYDVIWK